MANSNDLKEWNKEISLLNEEGMEILKRLRVIEISNLIRERTGISTEEMVKSFNEASDSCINFLNSTFDFYSKLTKWERFKLKLRLHYPKFFTEKFFSIEEIK